MGQIVSLHSKTLPSHNPRAKDGLRAVYVRTCHVFTSGSGVVHGWSRSGTGMERYGTGSGTKRPAPAQHYHHAAHLYQNSQFGARIIAQQAILRRPAGSSQSASLQSNTTAVPQPAATLSGAGTNLPQVEREGGLQAIHS